MSVNEHAPLAIVTGAQQGIGEAIARALFCAGYDVVVADISNKHSAERFKERWGADNQLFCIQCDVGDESSVARLFNSIAALDCAPPSILVNNAATQFWGPMIDMTIDQWQRTLNVNLTGPFLMTREFARGFDAAVVSGVVINLGSGCNHLAFPQLAAYASSKGGLEMLTKASAMELGELGIRVNCIAPGAIETERTKSETDTYADSWSPLTPLQRVGTVNDVANAVLALVGENMSFVSGETIRVDGGLFARAIWPAKY